MSSGWVVHLASHLGAGNKLRAKLVGHNKEQAIIQATEQGNIRFVEATGLEYIEYGLVIYCIECIFDVKI